MINITIGARQPIWIFFGLIVCSFVCLFALFGITLFDLENMLTQFIWQSIPFCIKIWFQTQGTRNLKQSQLWSTDSLEEGKLYGQEQPQAWAQAECTAFQMHCWEDLFKTETSLPVVAKSLHTFLSKKPMAFGSEPSNIPHMNTLCMFSGWAISLPERLWVFLSFKGWKVQRLVVHQLEIFIQKLISIRL